MACSDYSDLLEVIAGSVAEALAKRNTLKNLDPFVLDNSLRESTVGQLRGHTLENKWDILETVKTCGFKHIIVSAFSHTPRVDDVFVAQLCERESDMSPYYAFSEIGEGADYADLPVGLRKMKLYKIQNPIFEIDLADCDDEKQARLCELLRKRIEYAHDNLSAEPRIFVNLRDFPFAMSKHPTRVFDIVKFLGEMAADRRPFGILFEEPTGRFLPETLSGWTKAIRQLMDRCGWQSGLLLAHIHEKWSFGEVTQLECLSSGANGIWASICEEGAALGHSCSAVSLMNLIRMGNTKALGKYNCTYLREAAIKVTKITTGLPPHPKMPIYGERALDIAFDFAGIAGGHIGKYEFDIAKFFGVEPPTRISTLASNALVLDRLHDLYGDNTQFTEEVAASMKEVMIQDLCKNRKEEYMSYVGIAILFDRAGGKITEEMSDAIANVEMKLDTHRQLLEEVRTIWDEWDNTEEERGDDCLEFYSFYNGFMSPYFGCYECEMSRKGLQAIDMDADGKVDWKEFQVYLKWALHEYPDTATADELLGNAFVKGIIPSMSDEIVKNSK